jgi:hypothetical protein
MRSTIVVRGRTSLNAALVSRVRELTASGLQIVPVAVMAARLAGGFLRPVDADGLARVIGEILKDPSIADLGDLAPIRDLPGVRGALVNTLGRA